MASICDAPWEYDAAPFRVTDDVWFVGNRDVSAHIIDTGNGLILIDTAYPKTAYLLLESIRMSGFDPADIRYILHTHAHYDHIGATRMLAEKYGCRTFLGEKDAFILNERPELTWHIELKQPFTEAFIPDVLLKDGDVVKLGRTEISCISSPGHTPGNMTFCWHTHWKGRAYSCAITGGYWPNTVSSSYMRRYGLSGWRKGYEYTFSRLARLSPDITLGAHPSFNDSFGRAAKMSEACNPFIDSSEWKRELDEGLARYKELCNNDPL